MHRSVVGFAPALGLLIATLPRPAAAQAMPAGFGEEFLGQFDASAGKLVALARAMPAETYGWRPMEGVASVADAYMHIARYNYYYPDVALGVEPPADVDYENLQGVVNRKEEAVRVLERSMEHVRALAARMDAADLVRPAQLYGRDVQRWAVLFQLIAHMNEHLGQSIAYARMNQVVPPWSR